jgi:hypothetical protein
MSKHLSHVKAGEALRADKINEIIDFVNSLRITAGPGIMVVESSSSINIALDPGPEKKVAVGTD